MYQKKYGVSWHKHLPFAKEVAIELVAVMQDEDWVDPGPARCAVMNTQCISCLAYEQYRTRLKLIVRMEDIF